MRLEEEPHLVVPLLDPDGADIEVTFTDGESSSAEMSLTISSLPAAQSGALDDLESAIEGMLQAATEALDKTYPDEWEHWRGQELNQMPEYLMPLMRTWTAFFDDENPEAWVNRDLDADSTELLERILAGSTVIAAIEGQKDFLDSGESTLNRVSGGTTGLSLGISPQTIQFDDRSARGGEIAPRSSDNWELESLITINDANDLQFWINEYQDARRFQRDLELFDDTVGAYLTFVATAASIPAGGSAGAGSMAARLAALETVSNVASTFANVSGISMWFLPCCNLELNTTLNLDDGVIEEEDAEANQISLDAAEGRIESPGVDLTRELAERVVGQLASVLNDQIGEVASDYLGNVATEFIDDWGADAAADQFLSQFPSGAEMVFYWEGIDLMAGEPQKWLEVELDTFASAGTPIVEQAPTGDDRMEFRLTTPEAFMRQDSMLRFRTNYDELETSSAIDTQEIELNYIELNFDPARINLTENDDEPIPFSLTIDNSILHPDDEEFVELPLFMDQDIGEVEFLERNGNVLDFHYHPPDDYPGANTIIEVSTFSTSSKGIRGDSDAPLRSGTLFITTEPELVDIVPRRGCLASGETLQFEAYDPLTGEPASNVTWSASSGSVSSSGLFTAPGSSGDVTVTATTDTESSSATITVGECACYWDARVSGDFFGADSKAGKVASLTLVFDGDQYTGVQMFGDGESPNTLTTIMLDFEQPVARNTSGPTTTTATFDMPGNVMGESIGLEIFMTGGALPPLTVNITEREAVNDPTLPEQSVQMAGTISGMVTQFNLLPQPHQLYANLNIEFSGIFSFRPPTNDTINCQVVF